MMPCDLQRELKILVETILSTTKDLDLRHSFFRPVGSFLNLGPISSCKERDPSNSGWITTTSQIHVSYQKVVSKCFESGIPSNGLVWLGIWRWNNSPDKMVNSVMKGFPPQLSLRLSLHAHVWYTWNPKEPFINGCFNWVILNHYIKNCCFTKHPFKNGCLEFEVPIS